MIPINRDTMMLVATRFQETRGSPTGSEGTRTWSHRGKSDRI